MTRAKGRKNASKETLPGTEGYEVTTSGTAEDISTGCTLIAELESYITSYVTFEETCHALVIALWLMATHVWPAFDAFPYLVVTSATKRSGKTRLLELISFVASNSRLVANISRRRSTARLTRKNRPSSLTRLRCSPQPNQNTDPC